MKQKKTHYTDYQYDDEDDEYGNRKNTKKSNTQTDITQRRRPIKNWTKVWSEHADEADEYDEFYAKK